MKRYLLALIYFLAIGWMPMSTQASNSDVVSFQTNGLQNNKDLLGVDKNGVVYTGSGINIQMGGPSVQNANTSYSVPVATTTSIVGEGLIRNIWLIAGSQPVSASTGSIICATTTVIVTNYVSGWVCPAVTSLTNFMGVSVVTSSTGNVIPIYTNGWVLALTTGTVAAGDVLVSSGSAAAGYLGTNNSPTSGTDIGTALGSGISSGGLTRVWIH